MGGHGSGGLFSGSIGERSSMDSFSVTLRPSSSPKPISNPVTESIRTGSALKPDAHHAFPDIIDNYAGYATRFTIVGGDGKRDSFFSLKAPLTGRQGCSNGSSTQIHLAV